MEILVHASEGDMGHRLCLFNKKIFFIKKFHLLKYRLNFFILFIYLMIINKLADNIMTLRENNFPFNILNVFGHIFCK